MNYEGATFNVVFDVKGLDKSLFRFVPGLEEAMKSELVSAYNMYVERANNGVMEALNNGFEALYPNYFKENKDKEWWDLKEYNSFMAEGYDRLISSALNRSGKFMFLEFYTDPEEVQFKGRLRYDSSVTIGFHLKQVS